MWHQTGMISCCSHGLCCSWLISACYLFLSWPTMPAAVWANSSINNMHKCSNTIESDISKLKLYLINVVLYIAHNCGIFVHGSTCVLVKCDNPFYQHNNIPQTIRHSSWRRWPDGCRKLLLAFQFSLWVSLNVYLSLTFLHTLT